jgi:hypothetical protein
MLELIFVGLADVLLFHVQLFCLIGEETATLGTFAACPAAWLSFPWINPGGFSWDIR